MIKVLLSFVNTSSAQSVPSRIVLSKLSRMTKPATGVQTSVLASPARLNFNEPARLSCGLTSGRLWADLGPTSGRLWTDFGPTLDRLWTDFGPTLDRLWTDLGPTLGRLWAGLRTQASVLASPARVEIQREHPNSRALGNTGSMLLMG